MGILDSLLGRTKPVQPNLDALFAVPNAAITLEVGADLRPTGVGSVCFRAAEGSAFTQLQAEIQQLLDADGGPKVEVTRDEYGFTWLRQHHDSAGRVGAGHRPARGQHARCRTMASVRSCSARWSGSPTRRPPRRAGLPLQARHVLPVRATRRASSGTTPSSCRCAGCSRVTCASRATCRAGSPSGGHRVYESTGARPRLRYLFGARTRLGR